MKISIIIPVYNLEDYIATTLKSCREQSYSDFEVIIVDDGSTDSSSERIRPYLDDHRFRYFRQKNAGVSAARNKGIEESTGEFITFLDGDDTLAPDTLERFAGFISGTPDTDWVLFSVKRVLEDGSEMKNIPDNLMPSYCFTENERLSLKEAFQRMEKRTLHVCVGGVFYRRSKFGFRFINGRFEDTYIIMEMLQSGDRSVDIMSGGCYNYLHRDGSFINAAWSAEKWTDYTRVRLKTLQTRVRLFPESRSEVEKDLTTIRYNLMYLRNKMRHDKSFAGPLSYFEENVGEVGRYRFDLRKWLICKAKSLYAFCR